MPHAHAIKVFAAKARQKFDPAAVDMLVTRLHLTVDAVRDNAHLVRQRSSNDLADTVNAIIFSARMAADMMTTPAAVANVIHSAAKALLPSEFRPAAPAPL